MFYGVMAAITIFLSGVSAGLGAAKIATRQTGVAEISFAVLVLIGGIVLFGYYTKQIRK